MTRRSGFAALACLLLFVPGYAAAQTYPCPNGPAPGDRQIGVTGGSHGIAAVPICASSDMDGSTQATLGPPPPDPIHSKIDAAFNALEALSGNLDRQAALARDPKYKRYRDGFWDHFRARQGAAAGEFCMAMFANLDGMVAISGPGGDYRGAMLTFWGPDVPKPREMATVQVKLDQFDGPAQTVKAFNYTQPGTDSGVIAFAVPTIEAALDTMVDRQPFELSIKGKPVMKIEWHGGHAARDRLRACVKGK